MKPFVELLIFLVITIVNSYSDNTRDLRVSTSTIYQLTFNILYVVFCIINVKSITSISYIIYYVSVLRYSNSVLVIWLKE